MNTAHFGTSSLDSSYTIALKDYMDDENGLRRNVLTPNYSRSIIKSCYIADTDYHYITNINSYNVCVRAVIAIYMRTLVHVKLPSSEPRLIVACRTSSPNQSVYSYTTSFCQTLETA